MRTKKKHARIIGHLDMDAFFAAIEEHNNPRFAGLPLVVGADPRGGRGRGVVSTANYAARRYGIHSALPITRAWRLSEEAAARGLPRAIFLGGSWRAYEEVSRRVMTLLGARVTRWQQRGVDEAYFDASFTGSGEAAVALAQQIKTDIATQERLTASIGLGPNKLIAKIASDYDKPDGLTAVPPSDVLSWLGSQPIRVIPGVGPKTAERLARLGVTTVLQARGLPHRLVQEQFGAWGVSLYERVRGIDDTPLCDMGVAKSIGHNSTFGSDTLSSSLVIGELLAACRQVHRRLVEGGFRDFRTVVVTARFANFVTRTRSRTLPTATGDFRVLQHEALRLLLPFFDHRENPGQLRLRLVGVRVEKLSA